MTKLSFMLFFLFSAQVQAQNLWNLATCVDYAVENNIDLNIKKNQLLIQEINLKESKTNLFPDLNLGSNLNFNYGRNIDGATNDITYEQTISNNLWLSSSVDLFQGFVKQNNIQFNKYLLSASKEERELVKNKLIMDVITAYYISLYSKGLVDVAKNQVALSKMQYQRMQKFVDVGKESQLSVLELKSQWVADKLNLTKTKNLQNKKILELKQLLRLETNNKFELDTIKEPFFIQNNLPVIDSLYNKSLSFLPEIKQQTFLLNASEKNLAISKGKIAPRVYMSAGLNSYFFNGSKISYTNQIKDNQNQYVNLGVIVPVFNTSVRSDIQRKRIDLKNQQLHIEKQKDRLLSQIQKVYNDVKSAESEYHSSVELLKYSKLSFVNTSKKLEKGLANASDFELAKQRLASAKAAKLKAKLSYKMHSQILEFYKTGNWKHLY